MYGFHRNVRDVCTVFITVSIRLSRFSQRLSLPLPCGCRGFHHSASGPSQYHVHGRACEDMASRACVARSRSMPTRFAFLGNSAPGFRKAVQESPRQETMVAMAPMSFHACLENLSVVRSVCGFRCSSHCDYNLLLPSDSPWVRHPSNDQQPINPL